MKGMHLIVIYQKGINWFLQDNFLSLPINH
jgi:hypothetical protein